MTTATEVRLVLLNEYKTNVHSADMLIRKYASIINRDSSAETVAADIAARERINRKSDGSIQR